MSALYIVILLVLAAVVAVLALGIGNFGKGGSNSAKRSNKLMQYRILFQALAVILVLLFIFLSARGGGL